MHIAIERLIRRTLIHPDMRGRSRFERGLCGEVVQKSRVEGSRVEEPDNSDRITRRHSAAAAATKAIQSIEQEAHRGAPEVFSLISITTAASGYMFGARKMLLYSSRPSRSPRYPRFQEDHLHEIPFVFVRCAAR